MDLKVTPLIKAAIRDQSHKKFAPQNNILILKFAMEVVIPCFIFQIMAELQSDDFLETSVSLTEPIPTKFLNLHKKIESISHIRRETQKQKSILSQQARIVQLEQKNNQFLRQAEAKLNQIKAQFVELKLLALKSQKQMAIKRTHRQQKIKFLKQLLAGALLNEKANLINFEEKFNQKLRGIQKELAQSTNRNKQAYNELEGKLCQVLPRTYQIIMSSSKYQQNKLQNIYQTTKAKASSFKQNILDHQMHEYQTLTYINQLIAETAAQISNDLQNQRKQRETHRLKIVKLIMQTQYHNSLHNK